MIALEQFGLRYSGALTNALNGIDLRVRRGEFLLITGPTGSGKTTLLRALAGLTGSDRIAVSFGRASIDGVDIGDLDASDQRSRIGILFQNPDDQITGLTPREEISFGLENLGLGSDEVVRRTLAALRFTGLEKRADEEVHSLSGGQKQRVALAAVAAMEPELLLLDEPISNLDRSSRNKLVELLGKMKELGKTILVCSHEVEEFLPLCDQLAIMLNGSVSTSGEPSTVLADRELMSSVGLDQIDAIEADHAESEKSETAKSLLSLTDVSTGYNRGRFELGPLNFEVRPGEIVAVLGENGCGKTTLLSLLAGTLKQRTGKMTYDGLRLKRFNRAGLLRTTAYVTQNPDLMLHCSTVEKELSSRSRYLKLQLNEDQSTEVSLKKISLAEFSGRHPFSLSQGQRQRLALGAAVAGGVKLLLVDEPTTGQDWLQIKEIFRYFRRLADEGAAVVFSTHNIRAAVLYADKGILLAEGNLKLETDLHNPNERAALLSVLDEESGIGAAIEMERESAIPVMDYPL